MKKLRLPRLLPKGWVFEVVYICVAIATFEHTAWAAGTLFLGEPSAAYFTITDPIWLRGGLVAVAVDVGMFLVAQQIVGYVKEGVARHKVFGLIALGATFFVISVISFFAQLVFAYYHTPQLAVATGVATYWQEYLHGVIEAAPFIFAGALPLMAFAYTLSRISISHTEVEEVKVVKKRKAATKPQYKLRLKDTGEVRSYQTDLGFKRAMARYRQNDRDFTIVENIEQESMVL